LEGNSRRNTRFIRQTLPPREVSLAKSAKNDIIGVNNKIENQTQKTRASKPIIFPHAPYIFAAG
jgi:hypothetical protein